jgi:mono/diheme cytochrome c family protein
MSEVVTPAHPPRLSFARKLALFGAPAAVTVLAWYALPLALERVVAPEPPSRVIEPRPVDGAQLFVQHCAYCHGVRGDGKGVAALNPPARYFGAEKYKLACTDNTVPTDDDLLRILRRGIPGTAMPSFANLSDAELRAVIAHVRTLTWRGLYDTLWKKDYDAGDDPDPVKLAERVDRMTTPGQPLPVPPIPPATPESVKKGWDVFRSDAAGCKKCHGEKGLGDGPQVSDPNFKNENGTRAKPRDLTAGIFKGGREPDQLYVRIWNGIPGTPMPEGKVALKPDEVIALVHFIRSLSPEPVPVGPTGPTLTARP